MTSKQTKQSIWKPISELPETGNYMVEDLEGNYHLCFYVDNKFKISGSYYTQKEEDGSTSFGSLGITHNSIKRYCSLTDFINHQEKLEERIAALEGRFVTEAKIKSSTKYTANY